MRQFRKPGAIATLSLEARVVYTGFCLFLLVGYLSSAWFYLEDGLGVRPSSAATYYLGGPDVAGAPPHGATGGPSLELPDEPDAAARLSGFAKPARQVMETFHFHLFSVSVCLLIVAHLFMMCTLRTPLKAAVIAVASVATLLHLLTPPLIRFVSPSLAFLMFPSAIVMTATWVAMTGWPVVEMWRPGAGED